MEGWQLLLGLAFVAIVLFVGSSLERMAMRRIGPRPGRSWDRFAPGQKLAIAFLALVAVALAVTRFAR